MLQLCLVRHGETTATRSHAFGADEPLLADARTAAARLAELLPAGAELHCSPARRCLETAAAAGLTAAIEPALDQVDIGDWRGRTFADVHEREPAAMRAWLADPQAAPHGGESLAALAQRTGAWLEQLAERPAGALVAVTHSEVVRTLVVAALALPIQTVWKLAVAPLSLTELHLHDGHWTLHQLNRPVPA